MTKSKIFFILSLSFIAGISLADFYYPKNIGSLVVSLLIILALILLLTFRSRTKENTIKAGNKNSDSSQNENFDMKINKNKTASVVGFAVLFFALGIYLVNIKLGKINNLNLDGQNFSGKVKIIKEPTLKTKIQQLTVKPIDSPENKFLISADLFAKYDYGDILDVDCRLEIPKNDNLDFDWQMHLAKDGIFYQCQKAKIGKTGENEGDKIYTFILKLKNNLDKNISRLIPAPESGLLSGLLIGGDDRLSKNIQENFSKTGMTHIVAVSGYNVAIIVEYLMILGIFIGLWRRQAFYFAVAGIILFVILVGLPSSAVRAGVMGILLIWAIKNGRLANSQNAILFSAAIMLLANPLLLRWDIGFQLSFLATLGIVYFYPVLENIISKWTDARSVPANTLLEILFLTISAQIFVLPVILYNFHQLSLISPLANLLILPIIPLTMLLGFTSVIFSLIFFPIGQVIAWLSFLPLKYETLVINYLAGLKYASTEMSISWRGIVVWYIILIGSIFFINKRKCKFAIEN